MWPAQERERARIIFLTHLTVCGQRRPRLGCGRKAGHFESGRRYTERTTLPCVSHPRDGDSSPRMTIPNNDFMRTLAQDSGYFAYPSNSDGNLVRSFARASGIPPPSASGSPPRSLTHSVTILVWRDAKYPLSFAKVRIMSQYPIYHLLRLSTP